jgi:putative transposase
MCERGVFVQLWAALVERCDELDGVDWEWQAVDGSMVKARGKSQMGADAVGKNPTDREKRGEVESAGREDRQPPGHRDRRSERA